MSRTKYALLILDMMNTFDFKDGDKLLPYAFSCSKKILALKKRCNENKIPVIYVNDNFGKWRSNWKDIYELCSDKKSKGQKIATLMKPSKEDYFVLKPKHSAFFSTSLDVLLNDLKIKTLIVTGIAGNICVMFTVNDAHMREYQIIIPKDCIASNTKSDNTYALHHFENVFNLKTPLSTSLKFL